jgi:hypothetical protein
MAIFRPLTEGHQVDLAQVAPAAAPPEPRSLADLLPHAEMAPDPVITRQPPTKAEWLGMAALGLLLLALSVYLWSDARPAALPARPAATAPIGERTVLPSPIPATPTALAGRLLVAFAAPGGVPLGAIESTRAITPTAHYGSDWIQADVAGSGLIWLRAGDIPSLAITGPDLAPQPTATTRPYVPPTMEPQPPCAEAGIPGKMVRVCGYEDLASLEAQAKQQWIDQYGGNIGTVATPSPQVREP